MPEEARLIVPEDPPRLSTSSNHSGVHGAEPPRSCCCGMSGRRVACCIMSVVLLITGGLGFAVWMLVTYLRSCVSSIPAIVIVLVRSGSAGVSEHAGA